MRRRGAHVLLAAAGIAILTACGSTVAQNTSAGLGATDGLGAVQQPGADTAQVGTTGESIGTSGGAAVTPGASSAAGAPTASATDGGLPVVTPIAGFDPNAPATGSPVELGAVYVPDANQFGTQVSGTSGDTGDQLSMYKAAVAWANAHGGIGGHVIKLVATAVQSTSSEPYAQIAQDVCTAWTQDHHVVAGILMVASIPNDVLPTCMSQHKSMMVIGSTSMRDTTAYRQSPYMVSPWEGASDELMHAYASYAISKGLASKSRKVGVLILDNYGTQRSGALLVSLLQKAGVSVVSANIPRPSSTPDLAGAITAVQAAELKMKSQGVTTVMAACPSCISFFVKNAESQKYYPTYVVTSADGPAALTKAATANQLKDMVGLGWVPSADVGSYSNPTAIVNPTRTLCKQIEKPNGIKDDETDSISQSLCDAVLFVRAAGLSQGGHPVSGTTLLDGVEHLGSYYSAMTFHSLFSSTRRWGADSYRELHFVHDCGCVRYTSSQLFPMR